MIFIEVPNKNTVPDMSRLVTLYGNVLLRMCFLYLKDIHLAEDAVQDTFIKVNKKYSQFKGNSSEKTWVMKIAINVCKNYLRGPWFKHIDESIVLEHIPTSDNEMIIQDDTLILEIMKLSPKYKEVILLHYYQDMSIHEISETLQVPEATVYTRLKRARGLLQTKLKGWYYDE